MALSRRHAVDLNLDHRQIVRGLSNGLIFYVQDQRDEDVLSICTEAHSTGTPTPDMDEVNRDGEGETKFAR